MNFIGVKPKKIVFFPDALFEKKYIGELWGKHFAKSKVFNVFSDEESKQYATIRLGEIFATKPNEIQSNTLIGWWDAEKLLFQFNGERLAELIVEGKAIRDKAYTAIQQNRLSSQK